MNKGFFVEALAWRPQLVWAILKSNSPPDAWPPSEPLERWNGLCSALWSEPRARARLTPLLSRSTPFWDYLEESRRLTLLPASSLLHLTRLFGVAVHAPAIARCITRAEVTALRQSLGHDLYHYALHRGQYQVGDIRRLFTGRDGDLPLARRAELHGRQAVAAYATRWPDMLRRRAEEALLLSGTDNQTVVDIQPEKIQYLAGDESITRALWFALKKILLTEVVPAWAPCFD